MRDALISGMARLALPDHEINGEQRADRLLTFLSELAHWNRAYNLTAVRDPGEMVTRHVLDSLSIAGHVHGKVVVDVGAGAGLPGIPLAVVQPDRQFVLLDSNGKKARFMRHAVRALQLDNVQVEERRVETYQPQAQVDCVVARAFAALPRMLDAVAPICRQGTRILAMKGRHETEQPDWEKLPFRLIEQQPLTVPGLDAERIVYTIEAQ